MHLCGNKKSSNYCFIEIESLISEDFLRDNGKAEKVSELLDFYKMKDVHKKDFWKDLLIADKEVFKDLEAKVKEQNFEITALDESCRLIKDNIEYKKKQQNKEGDNPDSKVNYFDFISI